MGHCLRDAYAYIVAHPEVGQVALAWRDKDARDGRYKTGRILERYYANFGITRKWLGDHVGWFGGEYLTYSCDQEMSFRIQELGYQVVLLGGCKVEHLRIQDELREMWSHDHGKPVKFLAKWAGRVKHFPGRPTIKEGDLR